MLTGRYASHIGVYDNAAEFRADDADRRARAAGGRLPHRRGREDALHRPRSAPRLRGAPDDRHLSRRRRLDAGLEPPARGSAALVSHDGERPEPGLRGQHADRLRPGGRIRGRAQALRDRPPPGRPAVFLFASFTNPHDPWEIPHRFWDRYRRDEIDDPAVAALPLDEVDPHSRRLRAMCRVDEAELTAEQIRRARHGYFAAISYLDERIGEVLGALRDSGLEDRTTVLFCADHGEMLGERGLWYKMRFLEQSARVPLIVRGAGGGSGGGGTGGSAAAPGGGAGVPAGLRAHGAGTGGTAVDAIAGAGDGVSLPVRCSAGSAPEHLSCPSTTARACRPRRRWSAPARQDDRVAAGPRPALRPRRRSAGAPRRSGARRSRWRGAARGARAPLDLADIDRRVRVSQRERHLVSRALRQGPTPWDHEPPYDAAGKYIRNREDMYGCSAGRGWTVARPNDHPFWRVWRERGCGETRLIGCGAFLDDAGVAAHGQVGARRLGPDSRCAGRLDCGGQRRRRDVEPDRHARRRRGGCGHVRSWGDRLHHRYVHGPV